MFAVYILTNHTNSVVYTGVTRNLVKRIWQHKQKNIPGFTQKYNCTKLVYFELHKAPIEAIKRERAIKNLVRRKKNGLIERMNPQWKDLYEDLVKS